MRVRGKITKYEKNQFCMPLGEAEIELTLQEFASQVSECDIETSKAFKMLQDLNKSAPQPAEGCECKEPTECPQCGYTHKPYCLVCNKPIKPHPKPGEIEFDEFKAIDFLGIPGSKEIAQCMLKINQLIRTVNGRGK